MPYADSPFVCAYRLDRKGGGTRIDATAVERWSSGDGILWIHHDAENEAARGWLEEESGLDPMIAAALTAGETRPRTLVTERGLLLVLRGVNLNPGADPEDMVSLRVWLESDRIVTSRRRPLMAIQDLRSSIEAGHAPQTAGTFLLALIERLAERIGDVVAGIHERIDDMESALDAETADLSPGAVSDMRRQAAAIRRYLAPQREAMDRLGRSSVPVLSSTEAQQLREQADGMTRHLENLDLARERAVVLRDEYMSLLAQKQNERIYVLTLVAAVFLPLTFVTGALGMNVAGLPGTEHPAAFLIAMALMAGLGLGLAVFFKWKRWM